MPSSVNQPRLVFTGLRAEDRLDGDHGFAPKSF